MNLATIVVLGIIALWAVWAIVRMRTRGLCDCSDHCGDACASGCAGCSGCSACNLESLKIAIDASAEDKAVMSEVEVSGGSTDEGVANYTGAVGTAGAKNCCCEAGRR